MKLNTYNLNHKQRVMWAEWIDALESGDYKQANGWLRATPKGKKKDRFCCLGVVCDLNPHVEWDDPLDTSNDSETLTWRAIYNNDGAMSGSLTDLPWSLREDLGMSSELQTFLIRLNDAGAPFAAIAIVLREAGGFSLPKYANATAMSEIRDFTPVPD